MNPVLITVAVALAVNIIVFALYGSDKNKAVRAQRRIPERTLLIAGFIGPWGAVAGMSYFRHKTRKPKFKLNYFFLVLHVVVCIIIGVYL